MAISTMNGPADVPQQAARAAALSIRNLSKTFGGTRALEGISLDVRPGEVHGLVGQNGSGKSTLIKVLAGYHVPEPGARVEVAGAPLSLQPGSGDAKRSRMRFVHQDLGLFPELSAVENLFVDELANRPRWLINWRAERRRAREVFAAFDRPIDPTVRTSELSAADQAHLAIVRAVDQLRRGTEAGPGLLVLDEVTAFLPQAGRDQLFSLIREIVDEGNSVLFVSHYIDEVLDVTDRVTVLRDGRLVETAESSALDTDRLVELIIGRALGGTADVAEDRTRGRVVASVAGLTGAIVEDVSFDVHEGEVLGVSGLLGSGFEEIPGLLFGAETAVSGRLHLGDDSYSVPKMNPKRATAAGIAFVPENRDRDGGAGALTVGENVTLQVLDRHRLGTRTLRRMEMLRLTNELLEDFDVRPRAVAHARLDELSGGNQQKVILAKWLTSDPRLLLLHEPTHGVDVGSREEILARIRRSAKDGMAVICASSDPEQLGDLCDRVLIFGRGGIAADLVGDAVDKDNITTQCYAAG